MNSPSTYYRIEYKRGPNYGWEVADLTHYANQGVAWTTLERNRANYGLWKKNGIYRIVRVEEEVTEVWSKGQWKEVDHAG